MSEEEKRIVALFAERVRFFREQNRISQEKLAEKAGLHRTYIGSLERSEKIPSLVSVVKIAKALNVSVADLIMT